MLEHAFHVGVAASAFEIVSAELTRKLNATRFLMSLHLPIQPVLRGFLPRPFITRMALSRDLEKVEDFGDP